MKFDSMTTKREILLPSLFEGNTMKNLYWTVHLARLTHRYCTMSHAGMTTVWPPQQPSENSHTS